MGDGRDYIAVGGATALVGVLAIVGATKTDDTGPILAFVGALLVAVVTAYTADRRQRQQLAHDRELHDLDGLRDLFVRTSAAMFTLLPPVVAIAVAVDGRKGPLGDAKTDVIEAAHEIYDRDGELRPLAAELRLYFDKESAVYAAFDQFREAIKDVASKVGEVPLAEDLDAVVITAQMTTTSSANEFRAAARKAVEYRLPE